MSWKDNTHTALLRRLADTEAEVISLQGRLAQCDAHVRQQDVLLWQRQQFIDTVVQELVTTRVERDTARADLARVQVDRDKLFNECGAWEARYVKRGHKLLALQAKVARAVDAMTCAGPTWEARCMRALEALR